MRFTSRTPACLLRDATNKWPNSKTCAKDDLASLHRSRAAHRVLSSRLGPPQSIANAKEGSASRPFDCVGLACPVRPSPVLLSLPSTRRLLHEQWSVVGTLEHHVDVLFHFHVRFRESLCPLPSAFLFWLWTLCSPRRLSSTMRSIFFAIGSMGPTASTKPHFQQHSDRNDARSMTCHTSMHT